MSCLRAVDLVFRHALQNNRYMLVTTAGWHAGRRGETREAVNDVPLSSVTGSRDIIPCILRAFIHWARGNDKVTMHKTCPARRCKDVASSRFWFFATLHLDNTRDAESPRSTTESFRPCH